MNSVQLIGRVTKAIELKQTSSGKYVCRFTLAVDRGKKKENGEREADFISCVAWEGRAELMSRFVQKGDRIGIEGSIRTGSYDNDHGGKNYTTDVIVDRLHFLESKKEKDQAAPQENQQDEYRPITITEDDDLPF